MISYLPRFAHVVLDSVGVGVVGVDGPGSFLGQGASGKNYSKFIIRTASIVGGSRCYKGCQQFHPKVKGQNFTLEKKNLRIMVDLNFNRIVQKKTTFRLKVFSKHNLNAQ